MDYYGISDVGNLRVNNEDSYTINKLSDDFIVAVVADGMGGHNAGEKASRFAVDYVLESVESAHKYFEKYNDRQIENFLKNTVIKLNKEIYNKSSSDEKLSGMGTTLVICIIYKSKYYVSNVGDSRLYVFSDELVQITKDHSYVSELVEMGVITKEEAINHPNKNVITRAIGTELGVQTDIFKGKLKNNNTILMCSDGLSNMVDDANISRILSEDQNADLTVGKLVDLAKENGGKDNITVVCIRTEDRGENIL